MLFGGKEDHVADPNTGVVCMEPLYGERPVSECEPQSLLSYCLVSCGWTAKPLKGSER